MNTQSVQSLRGFACALLVLYHIIGSSKVQGLHVEDGWLRAVNDSLVVVRMPLFALVQYNILQSNSPVQDLHLLHIVPVALCHVRLSWIGDYAYAIFLFHVFFTASTRMVLNTLGVHAIQRVPALRFWVLGSGRRRTDKRLSISRLASGPAGST